MNLKELKEEASQIKKEFDNGTNFKNEKGILVGAKKSIDAYEGRQCLHPVSKKPVSKTYLNVIQNIVDQKASSINSKTFSVLYTVINDEVSTNNVTKFAEYQMNDMGVNDKLWTATLDGLIKGTYCLYMFWDEDAIGQNGEIEGAIRMQVIDLKDFVVSDPTETDVQQQEWIILHSRESIRAIKEMCTTLNDKEKEDLIKPYAYSATYTTDSEQANEEMTDLYTKFFRQNGEVYFTKATRDVVIQEPTSINPYTNKKILMNKRFKNDQEDGVPNSEGVVQTEPVNKSAYEIGGTYSNEEKIQKKYLANLYPIDISSFYRRDNCIYGLSIVEQIIPMQASINRLVETTLICSEKTAIPSLIVKEGALSTSTIDLRKSGQVLIDRSPYGQSGISTLSTGSVPTIHYELAQNLISQLKDNYRASDVLDQNGNIPSGVSGYAISQYMQIQDKPIAQWQEILSRTVKKIAFILEQMYKLYYRNKRFNYHLTDTEMLQRRGQGMDINTPYQEEVFNGEDYIETPFNVSVEVGEGARYSEAILVNLLETLILNGTIEKLSPESLMMYANMMPESYFPKKDEFKRLVIQKENSIIAQLQEQNAQLQQALQEANTKQQLVESEFTNKINQYNEQLLKLKNLNSYNKKTATETNMSSQESL